MRFFLDQRPLDVEVPELQKFSVGPSHCLSTIWFDPTADCDWYQDGYKIISYDHHLDSNSLVNTVERIVLHKLSGLFPAKDFTGFCLGNYHKFIDEDEHRLIADPVLKRLYVQDMPHESSLFCSLISDLLGHPMGFKRSDTLSDHWIILRLNPPYSLAYNPPHKDIYEDFDQTGQCPEMVNVWIPVVGVNSNSGLGLVPSSHLLPESKILRSKAGAHMNGRQFSVNMIRSWDNQSNLRNIYPAIGSLLCFSSHLVHGLGVNFNQDSTRVALEFRLHNQDPRYSSDS